MSHRHLRTRFRHAAPRRTRRTRRLPVMSATAIGLASVFAVTLNQSFGAATDSHTSRAAVLDMSGAQAALGGTAAQPSAAQPLAAAATPTAAPTPSPPAQLQLSYDFQLQTTFYYCGPAATRIAATARGLRPSQDELANQLDTTVNGTNSALDVARVLNSMTGTTFYHATSIPGQAATPSQMDQLQADVVHAVSNGYAVVANIIGTAWDTDGVAHSYDGGHYLTVVGYQDEGRLVKIADPANVVGDGTYWMTTINLANWVATRGYAA